MGPPQNFRPKYVVVDSPFHTLPKIDTPFQIIRIGAFPWYMISANQEFAYRFAKSFKFPSVYGTKISFICTATPIPSQSANHHVLQTKIVKIRRYLKKPKSHTLWGCPCLYSLYIEDITRWREDMNFICSSDKNNIVTRTYKSYLRANV